ncbi:MAG TPA: SsrA-binding protein [Bacteroidales bacterium]|nr:SsrA-binding protein [Bacteroidales bacterium]
MDNKVNIKNKKARFLYVIEDKYVAGIELYGTEIKAIRMGKASLTDSYCFFIKDELWVKMHISEYDWGTYANHDPRRDRKLLLTRRELNKLQAKVNVKGFTIIPLRLFTTDKGLAKLEIATASGKQLHDKRESLKDQDAKREMDRFMKK